MRSRSFSFYKGRPKGPKALGLISIVILGLGFTILSLPPLGTPGLLAYEDSLATKSGKATSKASKAGKAGKGGKASKATDATTGKNPVTWGCLAQSSRDFKVPLSMLLVIMDLEQGRVGMESRNKNGSVDYGPMQINSLWLPKLRVLGINERLLRDDGCVNVAVGAWLLRSHLKDAKDPWDAVAAYHSKTPRHARRYRKVALGRARSIDVGRTISRANGLDK
jgi:hypothetical protein